MSLSCSPSPSNKNEYLKDVGKILVKNHGKKRYYKPDEVKKAHRQSRWSEYPGFSCWAMSAFSSESDFTSYHERTDEDCDYLQMKTAMLQGIKTSTLEHPTPIHPDTSWLDLDGGPGDALDGIGEFFSSIFE